MHIRNPDLVVPGMKDTKNLPPGQQRPPYFDVGTTVVAGRGEARNLQYWTVCNARKKN